MVGSLQSSLSSKREQIALASAITLEGVNISDDSNPCFALMMAFLFLFTVQRHSRDLLIIHFTLFYLVMVPSLSLCSKLTFPKQLERPAALYLSKVYKDMQSYKRYVNSLPHSMSRNDGNDDALESSNNLDGVIDKGVEDQMEEAVTNIHKSEQFLKISHTSALCIVPPDTDIVLWEQLTRIRNDLKDPGVFRWPPHINLLYPFYEIPIVNQKHLPAQETNITTDTENSEKNVLHLMSRIRKATSHINPFHVSLHAFGCFGGKNRGVLWLYPSTATSLGEEEPIKQLYYVLQEEFPTLLSKTNKLLPFSPHMTLSHFENLLAAENAKKDQEERWISGLQTGDDSTHILVSKNNSHSFYVKEIYMLHRQGDDGQFHIVATIPLGKNGITSSLSTSKEEKQPLLQDEINDFTRHIPPKPFQMMPIKEENWVRAERIKLKERRRRKPRKRSENANNGTF